MFQISFNIKAFSIVWSFSNLFPEDLHSALFQISFAKRLISFFSSAKLALYSFNKSRREHASAPSCVAPMQAANWVAVKTTGTLKPPLQMCTLYHFALLHKCKRSETLAPFYLFILYWTLTMTTRLLQNVVKLLQSKIGAKLLQEGAYWRGEHKSGGALHTSANSCTLARNCTEARNKSAQRARCTAINSTSCLRPASREKAE